MSMEFNEEPKVSSEESVDEGEYVYKKVIQNKQNRRTWSLASLALAILSLLLTFFPWIGLIVGLSSAGAATVSRKNLGYFDKITLAGLIIAIFGIVFSLAGIIFADVFAGIV